MSSRLQQGANQAMLNVAKQDLKEKIKKHEVKIEEGKEVEVVADSSTRKIILPGEMNKLQGAFNLLEQFEEEEAFRTYNRSYDNFFVNDFLITMQTLIPQYFGMLHVSPVNTAGYPAGQDYVQIPIAHNRDGSLQTEKAYVGSIKAPVWEGAVVDILPPGIIRIRAKMKFETNINAFLEDVEKNIRANSVVKGKSVTPEGGHGGMVTTPILAKTNTKIVLAESVERIITNLIIPGMSRASKTSLLFTGDFGTGKTETALKVGVEAQKRFGRTFFYLHNAETFTQLIPYIKNYQPAIVFVEDVDQISAGDRDSNMNNLLNQLDGNELKNIDCTFIFTTNNHDKIHPAMRRPGRIDQVVHFDYCDKQAVEKIFKLYAAGMQGEDTVDYAKAAESAPANLQGAVVAEIARRAIQYAEHLYESVISTDRFLDSISSMEHHIRFMKEEQKKDHTAEGLLGHLLYKGMKKAFPNIENQVVCGRPDFINFADSEYAGLDN